MRRTFKNKKLSEKQQTKIGLIASIKRKPKSDSEQKRKFSLGNKPRAPKTTVNRISTAYIIFLLMVISISTGAFAYHLSIRFEGVRLGYETSKQRALQTKLLNERRELRLELATLKSPEKVEEDAREKLGMKAPDLSQIVTIGKKRRVVSVSGGAL